MGVVKIDKFVINTEKDAYLKSQDLVKFLDDQVQSLSFQEFISKFSILTNLPPDIIAFEIKQVLMRRHDFQTGKFKKIFHFYRIFKSSIIFFLSTMYILIFSKTKIARQKTEIIFDEIESLEEFKRIYHLKKNLILTKQLQEKKILMIKTFFFSTNLKIVIENIFYQIFIYFLLVIY